MWARVVEILLALWLFCTPWIFDYPRGELFFWVNDLVSAVLIGTFGLVSFCPRYQRAHLGSLIVGLWLWGVAYRSYPLDSSSAEMNAASVGLFILMLAIVPSRSHQLSPSWAKFRSKD